MIIEVAPSLGGWSLELGWELWWGSVRPLTNCPPSHCKNTVFESGGMDAAEEQAFRRLYPGK